MPALVTVMATAGQAGAGVITGVEAFGPQSVEFFIVNELATSNPNNDNAEDPILNRFRSSEGFLTPAPIDIRFTVVDEPGDFPTTTEYSFEADVTNHTAHDWFGFQHEVGFGTGDDFEIAPLFTVDFDSPDVDPWPESNPFPLLPWFQYSGARVLQWWGGQAARVQPGGQIHFCFYLDVPNDSQWIPAPFRTPAGYTFTLRQYPKVPAPPVPPGWYRGNTHTHSHLSVDGHDSREDLVAFYAALGYDFLVLTDHHGWSDFSELSTPGLLCISGEEITVSTNHTIGIDTTSSIFTGTLNQNLAAVLAQGGLPYLAHPTPTLGGSDALGAAALKHMEIYNDFFCCPHTYLDVWDDLLSAGKLVYGIAADDTHYMVTHAGKAWIVVRADVLDRPSIKAAMLAGDFYASTGITLNDYAVDDLGMYVDSMNGERVTFIGHDGVVLQQTQGSAAQYVFQGFEPYVRAEVQNSWGQFAWMQPVFLFPAPCPWDCDGGNDGSVNVADLLSLLGQYDPMAPIGCAGGSCDYDGSGCVDVSDLLNMLAHFSALGFGCP